MVIKSSKEKFSKHLEERCELLLQESGLKWVEKREIKHAHIFHELHVCKHLYI